MNSEKGRKTLRVPITYINQNFLSRRSVRRKYSRLGGMYDYCPGSLSNWELFKSRKGKLTSKGKQCYGENFLHLGRPGSSRSKRIGLDRKKGGI